MILDDAAKTLRWTARVWQQVLRLSIRNRKRWLQQPFSRLFSAVLSSISVSSKHLDEDLSTLETSI